MEYSKFFDTAKLLFEHFGWKSFLLVIATTLIMIPVNMLWKKLFKQDNLDRLRKTVSCLSVYLIAFGIIAFFTSVVLKETITLDYLVASSMNCGLLSMLLWAIIKFVRDYGWMPVANAILENKKAKAWLNELGVPEKLVEVLREQIVNKIGKKVTLDEYLAKEPELISHLRLQMSGFLASDKINQAITNILKPIKEKLK